VPRRELTDLFQAVKSSFGDAFEPGPQSDPFVETGHYDDGHAFGWKPRRQKDAWNSLTTSLAGREDMEEVIAQIESQLGVDIDADGDKGAPRCVAGSYASPPRRITVPPTGTASSVFFRTPIPNAAYYDQRHGYAGGGCDRPEGKMVARVRVRGGGKVIAYNDDDAPAGDRTSSGTYCPVPTGPDAVLVDHCLIFRPELFWEGDDAAAVRTYSVHVSFQNRNADQGGSEHEISIEVSWRPD
jgi:hypothetical protein